MNVLRRVLEVDFKDKDNYESQGIYLLTTGIPDQEMVGISHKLTSLFYKSRAIIAREMLAWVLTHLHFELIRAIAMPLSPLLFFQLAWMSMIIESELKGTHKDIS